MHAVTTHTILVASYLEPEHVERVRQVSDLIEVIYEPALIAPPRYAADHYAIPNRTGDEEARWLSLLARADILFDFDYSHQHDLPDVAPNVRWVQATSAGIGQLVRRLGYDRRMPNTVFTTSSGVHGRPLADFCLLAMLAFAKGLPRMIDDQRRHHWERFAGRELGGRTVGIIGVGSIGAEVARLARALDMVVVGVKRTTAGIDPSSLHLSELHAPAALHVVLARSEFLVLITPHTDETERMIGARELALLPAGAVVINIGRGALMDEQALISVLASGHLGGAALDVFATEPLPADSPLWDMGNVLISPHSASTSDGENARITDLFCDNLRRFLAREPLRNVLDTARLY